MSDFVDESIMAACVSDSRTMRVSCINVVLIRPLSYLEHLLLDLNLSLERVDLLLPQRPPVGRRPPPPHRRRYRRRRPLLELVLEDLLLEVALREQFRLRVIRL